MSKDTLERKKRDTVTHLLYALYSHNNVWRGLSTTMPSFVRVHPSRICVQKRRNETPVVIIYLLEGCLETQSKLNILSFWSAWKTTTSLPVTLSPPKRLVPPRVTS